MDRSFPSGTLPLPLVDAFFEAAEDDFARRGAPESEDLAPDAEDRPLPPDALFVLVAVDDVGDDDVFLPRADDVSFVSDIVADLFDERFVPSIVDARRLSTTTTASPLEMESPSPLSQLTILPSVIVDDSAGMWISFTSALAATARASRSTAPRPCGSEAPE